MSKKKSQKKIPTTTFARTSKLFMTTAKVVGREIVDRVSQVSIVDKYVHSVQKKIKHAQDIVHALGELKGAALKAGQLLSMEFSDLLPAEVTKVLTQLYDDNLFMPIKQVKAILKKELGANSFQQITNISEEPIAAASIGQVHTAIINGKKMAIKIQYPAVSKTLNADLSVLKKLFNYYLKLNKKEVLIENLFDEIKSNLKNEMDYTLEAQTLSQYRLIFSDYPNYLIPEVDQDYSSKKVLTMTYINGIKLQDFFRADLSESDQKDFSDLLLNLVFLEFFKFGIVQTDPNPGNFLILKNPLRLVLLDCGSVKTYSQEFRSKIIQLLKFALNSKDQELLVLAHELELLDVRESEECKLLYLKLMRHIVSMFLPENQPFDFSSEDYLKKIRLLVFDFIKEVKYTSPAKDLIFLNRKLGGIFHQLKEIGCKIDLIPYLNKSINSFEPAID